MQFFNHNIYKMKTASIYQDLEFSENKPAIKVLLETYFTKEILILLKKVQ